jgi:hypothetical protein
MSGGVLAQIGEIVARVRIRSITDLDFAGRRIEVPPPLPRRFPLLPMVDQLQFELYQKAYCLPISEVGLSEQAYTPTANDMRDALTAANATRTRIDRDWLVVETDAAGAVTVTKRSMLRRIPLGEIVTSEPPSGRTVAGGVFAYPGAAAQHPRAGVPFQGAPGAPTGSMPIAPPQPGKLVAIALPRERPDEAGFYFAFGEIVASTTEGRPVVRFYWNVPADAAPELMSKLTGALNAHSVGFAFKCPLASAAYRRRDAATLYIPKTAHDAAVPVIAEVHRALATRLRPDVPPFAKRLRPGLGFADDPGSSESFGMARCRLLAEALWTAFVHGAESREAILEQIEMHFLLNGIDLERAYLNPFAVDRYEHGAFC